MSRRRWTKEPGVKWCHSWPRLRVQKYNQHLQLIQEKRWAAGPDSAALEDKMEGWEGGIVCLQSTFPLLGVSPTNPCPGEQGERLPVSPLPRGSLERVSGTRSHVFWGHCKPSQDRGEGTAFSCWLWCPCGASRRIAPKVRSRTSTPLAGQNSA